MREEYERFRDQNFPIKATRFMRIGQDQGVNSYHLRGPFDIDVDDLTWVGWFPNAYGGSGVVAGGGLGDEEKYLSVGTMQELLDRAVVLPGTPAFDFIMTFGEGENSTRLEEPPSEDMPTVLIVFASSKATGQELVLLHAISELSPEGAMQQIRDGLARGISKRN